MGDGEGRSGGGPAAGGRKGSAQAAANAKLAPPLFAQCLPREPAPNGPGGTSQEHISCPPSLHMLSQQERFYRTTTEKSCSDFCIIIGARERVEFCGQAWHRASLQICSLFTNLVPNGKLSPPESVIGSRQNPEIFNRCF